MKIKLHPLRIFEKRHLVLFSAISVSLLLISYFIPMTVKVLLIALCAVSAVYFALSKREFNFLDKESKYHTVTLSVMIGAILLSSFVSYDIAGIRAQEYTGEHRRITAYALPSSENTVRITEIDGIPVSFDAVFYGSELPEKYEMFSCIGEINLIRSEKVSDSVYYIGDNIPLSVYSESVTKTDKRVINVFSKMYELNHAARNTVYKYCGENAGLISALFLGNKADVPENIKSDFSHTGVSHITAISGLHIMVAIAFAGWFLKKIIPHVFVRIVILDLIVVFYSLLVGSGYSVIRAMIMYTVTVLAVLTGEKSDTVTSLFTALYLICIIHPYAIFDISLQLSFAATLGIAVFGLPASECISKATEKTAQKGPILKKLFAGINNVSTSLTLSVCAVFATLPFCYLYFGRMSLLSPLVTLLVMPFITVLLYAAPFLMMFAGFEPVAQLFGQVCNTCAEIAVIIISFFRENANFEISFSYPFSLAILVITAVAFIALIIKGVNKKRVYAIVCLCSVIAYSSSMLVFAMHNDDRYKIAFTSYSGDVLCRIEDNKAYAVDISNGYGRAYTSLFSMLEEQGIIKLKCLILTHCSEKHIELIRKIDSNFGVDTVVYPSKSRYSAAVGAAVEQIGADKVEYEIKDGYSYEGFYIEPTHYISHGEGYNITTKNAVYFSGSRADEKSLELINDDSIVFYGCYSEISQMAFTPIYDVEKAVVSDKIRKNLFFEREYEDYFKQVNVLEYDGAVMVEIGNEEE